MCGAVLAVMLGEGRGGGGAWEAMGTLGTHGDTGTTGTDTGHADGNGTVLPASSPLPGDGVRMSPAAALCGETKSLMENTIRGVRTRETKGVGVRQHTQHGQRKRRFRPLLTTLCRDARRRRAVERD